MTLNDQIVTCDPTKARSHVTANQYLLLSINNLLIIYRSSTDHFLLIIFFTDHLLISID